MKLFVFQLYVVWTQKYSHNSVNNSVKISYKPEPSEQGGFTKGDNEWPGKTSHFLEVTRGNNQLLSPLGCEIKKVNAD